MHIPDLEFPPSPLSCSSSFSSSCSSCSCSSLSAPSSLGSPPSHMSHHQTIRIVYPRKPSSNGCNQTLPFRRITAELIQSLTHLSQGEAARHLGISISALKNACKALGVGRWPYTRRKTRSRQAASPVMDEVMDCACDIDPEWLRRYMDLGMDEDVI
mmetsp:Transcript_18142/g.59587  ORF Transcript_18142/g.59587 Transcript_18142/m.59587 type:complete len:157 (-) Transcript_18142:225-695(-)